MSARVIRIVTHKDMATGKIIARSPDLGDLVAMELHDSDLRFQIAKEIAIILGRDGHQVIVAPLDMHPLRYSVDWHSAWVAFPADEARRQLAQGDAQ